MATRQKVFFVDALRTLMIAYHLFQTGCSPMVSLRPPTPFAALGPGPLIIAHRGGSLEAPENTVASIRHGIEVGSDWQELDVTLSQDATGVVVIHDDWLERTTDGHGLVESKPLAELTALHAGQPRWSETNVQRLEALGLRPVDFGKRFIAERIPTLPQILTLPGARLMIELKHTQRASQLVALVVQNIHDAKADDRVALGSFDTKLLDAVHALDASLPLIGIVEEAPAIDRMLELPISVLAVDKALLSAAQAKAPPRLAVWTWTAYSVAEAEALTEAGAHGIITDAPQAVLEKLRPAP